MASFKRASHLLKVSETDLKGWCLESRQNWMGEVRQFSTVRLCGLCTVKPFLCKKKNVLSMLHPNVFFSFYSF